MPLSRESRNQFEARLAVPVRWRSWRGLRRSRRERRETLEQPAPIAGLVEDRTHLVTTVAGAIEPPVLELGPRPGIPFGDEADLDFRLQVRVILPIGGDVPREHEACMGLEGEHATPIARASVLATLIPAATDARLDDSVHG